jgi:hypothetical protein
MPVKADDYLRIAVDCERQADGLAPDERNELMAMAARLRKEAERVASRPADRPTRSRQPTRRPRSP